MTLLIPAMNDSSDESVLHAYGWSQDEYATAELVRQIAEYFKLNRIVDGDGPAMAIFAADLDSGEMHRFSYLTVNIGKRGMATDSATVQDASTNVVEVIDGAVEVIRLACSPDCPVVWRHRPEIMRCGRSFRAYMRFVPVHSRNVLKRAERQRAIQLRDPTCEDLYAAEKAGHT